MNSKENMDNRMYNAGVHVVEAAKLMSDVDKEFALQLMLIADKLLSIIDAPDPKLNIEQMDSILNDILSSEA